VLRRFFKQRGDRKGRRFITQAQVFVSFIKQDWHQVSSPLFVFEIEPLDPLSHCAVVDVISAISGKGILRNCQHSILIEAALGERL
jgi:hypothetical protein